jgi:isopenicillin N synthase-like dioxygenase
VIPVLDECTPAAAIVRACREVGAFEWRLAPAGAARLDAALAAATRFFARPPEDKWALDIRRSPHHRGYSEMHNARDWREQLHFGSERPPAYTTGDGAPDHRRLVGPNQWPADDPALRRALLAHLDEMARLGRALLAALELPIALVEGDRYLVMKAIHYHRQPSAEAQRPGVAAHVDYSLITLLAQDDAGGLEVMLADGAWHPVAPRPGALVVNLGEIAEAATGGALRATPHRVVNPSSERSRLSIPVFINPPLDARVEPRPRPPRRDPSHVHRVLSPGELAPFVFGDGEWRRKGENVWCAECCRGRPGTTAAEP